LQQCIYSQSKECLLAFFFNFHFKTKLTLFGWVTFCPSPKGGTRRQGFEQGQRHTHVWPSQANVAVFESQLRLATTMWVKQIFVPLRVPTGKLYLAWDVKCPEWEKAPKVQKAVPTRQEHPTAAAVGGDIMATSPTWCLDTPGRNVQQINASSWGP
jgi:hypothetical protein